ncbi:hypothetical protein PXO_05470 [Xanthomonas oryzae pv. oryzae PXO99A]|uniref:Uncharacterized protein n=1 Tax=Xanthomonas oryzae pv. oryzae (strain PXO99A) TaxID=360094 RepID=A0A0K0GH75_XANOP|nr:hypothetical protein PXO_05470 [Xanthomonas oryzae pv. oryzae PXO99A]
MPRTRPAFRTCGWRSGVPRLPGIGVGTPQIGIGRIHAQQ